MKASKELETLILERAPSFYSTADAPADWPALKAWYDLWSIRAELGESYVIPVSNVGCDRTIYSSPAVNYAFRAWHDSIHLVLDVGFDFDGELAVALHHVRVAELAGLPKRDIDMLWADTYGQRLYHEYTGSFVDDQEGFVTDCLATGVHATALSGVKY